MMKRILLYCMVLLSCNYSRTTQLIQGNVAATVSPACPTPATQTFTESVQAVAYDKANRIFYVGLAGTGDDTDTYVVSSFQEFLGSSQISCFKPRAVSTGTNSLAGGDITFLAMATADGDTCSRVAGVRSDLGAQVFILDITNNVQVSGNLRLYNSVPNSDGTLAASINALAANRCFIFADVSSLGIGGLGSGIAVVAIDQCALTLNQTAAVPGDSGIKAQQFNNTSSQLIIGSSTIAMQTNSDPEVQLLWDDQLERLYAGVSIHITPGNNTSGGRSIAVGTVGLCPEKGTLTLADIAPDAAFTAGNLTSIVGVVPGNTTAIDLAVNRLGMMHCSTGPSYLIVNGGNGTIDPLAGTAGNRIFALPVVDVCDPDDVTQGTLADKTQYDITTHRFRVAADGPNEVAQSTDMAAKVGNGPLPLQPNQTISGMQVTGDAVYISIQLPQSNTNETGILYSQAQFDNTGQIISWTPWTKRVWPICGFPDSPSNSQVSFFAVDAATGKVIAVDGTPQQTVRITAWDNGDNCNSCCTGTSLATALNNSLCDGCYSVLDLDQSTEGIGEDIPYRYALFGGTGKVDFALVSSSRAPSAPFDFATGTDIPYPQKVTIDYCCADFFLETTLSGCVNVLEYSRRTAAEDDTNYFFAGTDNGLYVFTRPGGNGFADTDLGLLSAPPFTDGAWQKIPTISGSITDIKTFGDTLYVMTSETSCATPFKSTIYRIDFADNISDMFAESNIITVATSGTTSTSSALQQTLVFTQMEIMQTSLDDTQEQLVLTTNNGIFQSKRTNGVQAATSEIDADWTLLQDSTLYYGMGAIDNSILMSTVWPFSAQDACGLRTYEHSSVQQLNGQVAATPTFGFVPTFFNHMITCSSSACQEQSTDGLKLFEKINYFWSDGGRRFFIITPTNTRLSCAPCCGNKSCCCSPQQNLRYLEVTPFNTCAWNICDPLQTVLRDCILSTQSAFYWVRPIGMTGIILAGTQTGVVALE